MKKELNRAFTAKKKTYIPSHTSVVEIAMTPSLMAGSPTPSPTPGAQMTIIDGGDPIEGR